MRQTHCVSRTTSTSKLQSDTSFNICIAKRCFYIACRNNYKFRPLYRPSFGCTLSYYKNYTIHNVFVFAHEILCTSVKFTFKIITVTVKIKCYSNMKGTNRTKSWVLCI